MTDTHDHDHGLKHDLPRLIGRRRALALLGMGGGIAMASPANALMCVADQWETAGPYPADGTNAKAGQTVNVLTQEGVIRHDIRPSFGGYSGTAAGVPLTFQMQLVDTKNGCAPLAGYAVYAWHCDATGNYTLYDLTDQNYLRGVGISDENGIVEFTSIFPGCYNGRWPHVHFEVFATPEDIATGRDSLLISQFAFAEADCTEVYAAKSEIYTNGTRNLGRQSLTRDGIFRDSSAAQMAQRTMAVTGDPEGSYTGTVTIGLEA